MRIAVIGAGVIGTAVVDIASEFGHTVTAFSDSESAITDPEGIDVDAALSKKQSGTALGEESPESALSAEYDILVEATPTTLDNAEPGFTHVKEALQRDRDVVLANKGPLALRYDEVRELEDESGGSIRFGATIGGALPVFTTIEDRGRAQIESVYGALDGTANFILSRMSAEGLDYDHVLAEAQDLGVAEPDPSFEVDGTDSALKGVILANILYDETYTIDDAVIEGIRGLSGSLLELAHEDGWTIRLVTEVTEEGIRVGPRLLNEGSPIAPSGTTTAVQFDTTYADRLNLSGAGTGGLETASTILSDINKLSN